MRMMCVSELYLDFTIYPRNNVDSKNVKTMVDALAAGAELPPVLIDRQSKCVVDGFHRVKACIRRHGYDGQIAVEETTYRNDAAIFRDAMRLNAGHGCKLDDCDKTHCLILGEHFGMTVAQMAGLLNMPVDRAASLISTRTARSASGETIPLKSTVREGFAGKKLTKQQEETNKRSSGMRQVFYVNQIIDLIESGMLYKDDESLMARLAVLAEHLKALL